MKRAALCAVSLLVVIALSCCLVACSSSLPETGTPDEGLYVAGIITTDDGTALSGAEISSDGETLTLSDDNGVFSATGLSAGDVVVFSAEGYSFSPSSFTVCRSVNDLRVVARKTLPEQDDDPTDEPDPDEETNPDDEPDNPVTPEPQPLPAPRDTGVVYGEIATIFFVTVSSHAETVSFVLSDGKQTYAATAPVADCTIDFEENAASLTVANNGETSVLSLDVTALLDGNSRLFDVTVETAAEGYIPSSLAVSVFFNLTSPVVGTPIYKNGVVTWSGANLPDDVHFLVLINGIAVADCTSLFVEVSSAISSYESGFTVRIIAFSGSSVVASSEEITVRTTST